MKRLLNVYFFPQLSMFGSFETKQFAYRCFHKARNAISYVVLIWLFAFANTKKVSVYCSDVAAAFDRVSTFKFLAKLRRFIIPRSIVVVIADWLVGRTGEMNVQGISSANFPVSNMTYQGTV